MRFSSIERVYDRLVAQGKLTERQAAHAGLVTIFEHATLAFLEGQYGEKIVAQAKDDVRAADDATRRAFERHAPDLTGLTRVLARESITTTLDLPAITGRARDIITRADRADEWLISPLLDGARKRTATDFRAIHGISNVEAQKGLYPTPEGTNVTYDKIERETDAYSVIPYSVASGWTWEARQNDDLGTFLEDVRELGRRATRNRIHVILAAIAAATSEATPSGTMPSGGTAAAGGPTVANIEWATATLAADNRVFGAVTVPPKWNATAQASSRQPVIPATPTVTNPVQGFEVNLERQLGVGTPLDTAGNWLAHEASIASWLEFAALDGFTGGARLVFKLPDTDARDLGSFENMTEAVKIVDAVAAKVVDADAVIEVKNA